MFFPVLSVQKGNTFWNNIDCPESVVFPWDHKSTYIRSPSFFSKLVSRPTFAAVGITPRLPISLLTISPLCLCLSFVSE